MRWTSITHVRTDECSASAASGCSRRISDAYDRTVNSLATLYEVYERAGVADRLTDWARVIFAHDARNPAVAIEPETQAMIVTSPPYFNAVDYPRVPTGSPSAG